MFTIKRGVAIPEKQNPGSETLNGAGRKTAEQKGNNQHAKRGRVLAF
jgi:hypothetical protein